MGKQDEVNDSLITWAVWFLWVGGQAGGCSISLSLRAFGLLLPSRWPPGLHPPSPGGSRGAWMAHVSFPELAGPGLRPRNAGKDPCIG